MILLTKHTASLLFMDSYSAFPDNTLADRDELKRTQVNSPFIYRFPRMHSRQTRYP